MRFHKAIKISRPEANFLIETTDSSPNDIVVMSHFDDWYDARSLTRKELDEFVEDLLRAELAELRAGIIPH
jgi:hypothetical protein